jgi:hypothetical protein
MHGWGDARVVEPATTIVMGFIIGVFTAGKMLARKKEEPTE